MSCYGETCPIGVNQLLEYFLTSLDDVPESCIFVYCIPPGSLHENNRLILFHIAKLSRGCPPHV